MNEAKQLNFKKICKLKLFEWINMLIIAKKTNFKKATIESSDQEKGKIKISVLFMTTSIIELLFVFHFVQYNLIKKEIIWMYRSKLYEFMIIKLIFCLYVYWLRNFILLTKFIFIEFSSFSKNLKTKIFFYSLVICFEYQYHDSWMC